MNGPMMTRRDAGAFTLVEIVVAVVIGILGLCLAWQAISVLLRAERSTDRESAHAMTQARMMDQLLADLRSAARVETGAQEFTVTRHVLVDRRAVTRSVMWRRVDAARVTRQLAGEPAQEYACSAWLDPSAPAFRLRLEKEADARFDP